MSNHQNNEFIPEYLYIEDYYIDPELIKKEKEVDEEKERGVLVIDLL